MHSYVFFGLWNFHKDSVLKSKDFCLVGDKLGVGHWGSNLSTDKKRGQKETTQVLSILLSLGAVSAYVVGS